MAANFNYFEGITFRNTLIAMEAGIKNIAGSVGLTVKHSKFEDVGVGIHTDFAGSGGYYIADNVFIGRHNAASLVGWTPAWKAVPGFAQDSRCKACRSWMRNTGNLRYNRRRPRAR